MINAPSVHVDSDSPLHSSLYKTLTPLRLFKRSGEAVYFVVQGIGNADDAELVDEHGRYIYDDHSCPTNYIPITAIMTRYDSDPHGCFEYVRTVWLPIGLDPDEPEGGIREIFPEIGAEATYNEP